MARLRVTLGSLYLAFISYHALANDKPLITNALRSRDFKLVLRKSEAVTAAAKRHVLDAKSVTGFLV